MKFFVVWIVGLFIIFMFLGMILVLMILVMYWLLFLFVGKLIRSVCVVFGFCRMCIVILVMIFSNFFDLVIRVRRL